MIYRKKIEVMLFYIKRRSLREDISFQVLERLLHRGKELFSMSS